MIIARSRSTLAIAVSLMVAFGAAACSDDDDTAETSGSSSTVPAQGSPEVSVTMADYSFAVSGPLTAGGTVKLSNRGQEFHVMALVKLKAGKTLADVQTVLQQAAQEGGPEQEPSTTQSGSATTQAQGEGEGEGEEEDPFKEIADEEVGPPGGFMGPGQSADVTVPSMKAGTYAMICFVPTEGEGTPHFAKGMVNQLQVVEGTAPPAPTADATYKLAPGEAVEGPATLAAGTRTLKFEAASGSEQLEPGFVKLNAGTSVVEFDEAISALFEGEGPPPKNAAATLPGQVVYATLDLYQTTTYYVRTNLSAGKYALVAEDTDVENRVKPPVESIEITVT